MNGIGTRLAATAASALVLAAAPGFSSAAPTREADYRTIVDRNPFGLKPQPPPAPTTPVAPPKPASDVKLTGITLFGSPKAYFMVTEAKGKPKYYGLGTGEGEDGLEVLEIASDAKSVKVRYDGAETVMDFLTHGIAAQPVAPAPTAGAPGAPGVTSGQPLVTPNTTAYNMPVTPAVTPVSSPTPMRTIPSRVPRTDAATFGMDPNMAARYGLTPSPGTTPNMPVYTAPAPATPSALSSEQQILMLELQRIGAKRSTPNVVMPPTPGLPGQ